MNAFCVTTGCRELGLRAAAMLLSEVCIAPAPADLRLQIEQQAGDIQRQFETAAHIRRLDALVAVTDILKHVHVKPRRFPPSSQKLMEYAWKRGTLPAINNLVDIYNLISIRSALSLGAHDLDQIDCPVQLRLFEGTEHFQPLGQTQPQPVVPGEFGYVDGQDRVLCRLDSLQADFSKVTNRTHRVMLIIETTSHRDDSSLTEAIDQLEHLLGHYCQARIDALIWPED